MCLCLSVCYRWHICSCCIWYCIWFCLSMFAYVWKCLSMSEYVWVCLSMSGYVWICLSVSGYGWVCLSMSEVLRHLFPVLVLLRRATKVRRKLFIIQTQNTVKKRKKKERKANSKIFYPSFWWSGQQGSLGELANDTLIQGAISRSLAIWYPRKME